VLSDCFTVYERRGRLDDVHVAYLGDGNNMANSWIEAAGLFGLDLVLACPDGYRPDDADVASCREDAAASGGSVEVVTDAGEAVAGAQVLYTDVWTSMGQEAEHDRRIADLEPYRLDAEKLALAGPDAIALHCLPAHVGEEITTDVLYGDRSLVWDQAENRLHVYKAVLALTVR
jgi:ornithine carbamoyltransferase